MVKPPDWTGLIPTYFWAGGWAGASATLGFTMRLAKNPTAARALTYAAATGSAISAVCLIADLKKPQRFLNMMRVFKPSSPMSVGVYLFGIFSGASMTAAASEMTGFATPLGRAGAAVAALCGPFMSVYTSVLIGDTVMPAWHYGRTSLPGLFAATSLSTAGGLGMLFIPANSAKPARRLAMLGAAGVPLALKRLHTELGAFQKEAYEVRKAATYTQLARALNVTGFMCTFFARRSRLMAKIAGASLLAAGLAERFAVYHAGKISAEDPKFTIGAESAP